MCSLYKVKSELGELGGNINIKLLKFSLRLDMKLTLKSTLNFTLIYKYGAEVMFSHIMSYLLYIIFLKSMAELH